MLSWWAPCCVSPALLPIRALAQDARTAAPNAKGSIIIDGKMTDLPYAYALHFAFAQQPKPETILIPRRNRFPKAVTDPFARMKARGSGNGGSEFT